MTSESFEFDPIQTLTDHAKHLNAICTPHSSPRIFYEVMSGGLVWSDETTEQTPIRVIWALRLLVAYRTSLILNEPYQNFAQIWEHGLVMFPRWVGFQPERRTASKQLLDIYHRGRVGLQ